MRYRADFLHWPTSAKITFTVPVAADETEHEAQSSAVDAMARRAAMGWAHESGLHGLILLGVVRLTDKMSVWREATSSALGRSGDEDTWTAEGN